MIRASDRPTTPAARSGRGPALLVLIRVQTALHEKAAQFALIGLAWCLAAAEPGWRPLLRIDLAVFALAPLTALLARRGSGVSPLDRRPGLVLLACALFQVACFAGAAACAGRQWFWPAAGCFLVFAVQSAWMERNFARVPSSLAPEQRTAPFEPWWSLAVPAGIALGALLAGELFAPRGGSHGTWLAGTLVFQVLAALSLVQALLLLGWPAPRAQPSPAVNSSAPHQPAAMPPGPVPLLSGPRDLRLATLGVGYFWFAAATTSAALVFAAHELAGPGPAALAAAARFTASAAAGIVLGCLAVSLYCRRGLELDLVPAAALGLAGGFVLSVLAPARSAAFPFALLLLGLSGGVFSVSLHGFLRLRLGPDHRRTIPALQGTAALAQLAGLGLEWLLRATHAPARLHFAVLGLLSAGAVAFIARLLPRHFLRFFFTVLVRTIYRIRRLHPERVPAHGGVLMISNHVSYVDAFLLSAASPRPVRFVMVNHFLDVPAFGWFLRLFDVIPISATRAKDAIRTTADALRRGDLVCIFPEGQLTRTGMLNELKKGFELIVRQAGCPVLPVYMDSVWGSIFSFERFRYFFKLPRRLPYPVTVNFGQPVPAGEIGSQSARALIQELSVEAFAHRPQLRTSLGASAIRRLRRHGSRDFLLDLGTNPRVLGKRDVLCTCLALALAWNRRLGPDDRRIGILLPPGSMPVLLHLTAVFARRVPVHLPLSFLQNPAAREAFLREHGIRVVISSRTLFPAHALPAGWTDLRAAIPGPGFARKCLARLSQRLLPAWVAIRRLGLHRVDSRSEAAAYVDETTGRLVALSHLNLLAAVQQLESALVLLPGDRIVVDESFTSMPGLLFGLWHPCLEQTTVLFRTLSARKTDPAVLLREQEPEVVLLSPDLLARIAGSGEPLPSSIRMFLDFSPAHPPAELVARLQSAGAAHCAGFAPAGFGAIVSMNTADPNSMIPHHLPQTGNQPGTVGRLLPGLSARLLSDADEALTLSAEGPGKLAVRGSSLPGEPDLVIDGTPHHRLAVRARFDRLGFLTVGPLLAGHAPGTGEPPATTGAEP